MCATDNCESIIFSFRLSDMPPSNNKEVMGMVSEMLGKGLNPTISLKVYMTPKTYGSTKCYMCEIKYTDRPKDETVFNRRVSLLKNSIFDTILIGNLD